MSRQPDSNIGRLRDVKPQVAVMKTKLDPIPGECMILGTEDRDDGVEKHMVLAALDHARTTAQTIRDDIDTDDLPLPQVVQVHNDRGGHTTISVRVREEGS